MPQVKERLLKEVSVIEKTLRRSFNGDKIDYETFNTLWTHIKAFKEGVISAKEHNDPEERLIGILEEAGIRPENWGKPDK